MLINKSDSEYVSISNDVVKLDNAQHFILKEEIDIDSDGGVSFYPSDGK